MRAALFVLLAATAIAFHGPAIARVSHLKCSHNDKGRLLERFATIDLDRKIAKFSDRPVDDRPWSPAEVTEASVTWTESTRSVDNRFVLDRRSGRMQVRVRNKQRTYSNAYNCAPTDPSRRGIG